MLIRAPDFLVMQEKVNVRNDCGKRKTFCVPLDRYKTYFYYSLSVWRLLYDVTPDTDVRTCIRIYNCNAGHYWHTSLLKI